MTHTPANSPAKTKKPSNSAALIGSYSQDDCEFLLQEVDIKPLSVAEKEAVLQNGGVHYSKIISNESPPSQTYLDTFHTLVSAYTDRLAAEIKSLAKQLFEAKGPCITLVSLARAGTPIGVLLSRALKQYHTQNVKHFSISIVRDRGIDTAALEHIKAAGYPAESIVFVDGWTAKGVINKELKAAVAQWNSTNDYPIGDELCVISDLSGNAQWIATTDDYAIPSGVLNSTVSGLLSRTLMLDDVEGFHQCIMYQHLQEHDLSNWFVDTISQRFDHVPIATHNITPAWRAARQSTVAQYIQSAMARYGVSDINKIKPGVAEATRVMLRRVPKLLVLRDASSPDVAHLKVLASEKNITIEEDKDMPFSAIALIENVTAKA